jgi:hypothetical protein
MFKGSEADNLPKSFSIDLVNQVVTFSRWKNPVRDQTYICNDKNNNYTYVTVVMFRDQTYICYDKKQ